MDDRANIRSLAACRTGNYRGCGPLMSKKTQIAKLILAMKTQELLFMGDDFRSMQSEAEDDGSEWRLDTSKDWAKMLHSWAEGLGSME
jgi:hypothetical protein